MLYVHVLSLLAIVLSVHVLSILAAIVLSVQLRITDSDYPVGIFSLLLTCILLIGTRRYRRNLINSAIDLRIYTTMDNLTDD